jgi:putative isomerase
VSKSVTGLPLAPGEVIRRSLQTIFREPEGHLRHPYVDPGGVYGKNLWDWDSFWILKTALGVAAAAESDEAWCAMVTRHAAGVLDNFFDHQGADGSLPILMTPGDPDWFDSTSVPTNNMAKPVFGQLMGELKHWHPDRSSLVRWCEKLNAYYDCFANRYRAACGLYVWANDIAIGSDDDPATWGRPPFSSANLLLNNLLHADLTAAAGVAAEIDRQDLAGRWTAQASHLADRIRECCWDERDGFYYSVDVQVRQRTSSHRHFGTLNENLVPSWSCLPLKILYWTGFLPMWTGLATPAQADRLVREHLLREDEFWAPHGVRTLALGERMYDPQSARGNPSNWLGPVWILSNYFVWEGLRRYGFAAEAEQLAERTLALLSRDQAENGHWHENYHPDTGRGLAAPGFVSWNGLVYFMLEKAKSIRP